MRILKNILLSTFITANAFASGAIHGEVGHFEQTDIIIFPHIQAEELKNWIMRISALLPSPSSPEWIQPMNTKIPTKIPRPVFNNNSLPQRDLLLKFGIDIIALIKQKGLSAFMIDQLALDLGLEKEFTLKIQTFYQQCLEFVQSNNKVQFIQALSQESQDDQDAKAFLCLLCITESPLEDDITQMIEILKSMDSRYSKHWAPWVLNIATHPNLGIDYGVRVAYYLSDFPEYQPQLIEIYLSHIKRYTREIYIHPNSMYTMFKVLRAADPAYTAEICAACLLLFNKLELNMVDKMEAADYLMDFAPSHREQIVQDFLAVLMDPVSTEDDTMITLESVKFFTGNYKEEIKTACLRIIRSPSSYCIYKETAAHYIKDFEEFQEEVAAIFLEIIRSLEENHSWDKLSAANVLKSYGRKYQKEVVAMLIEMLKSPEEGTRDKLSAVNYLKSYGTTYQKQIEEFCLPIWTDPNESLYSKLAVAPALKALGSVYKQQIKQVLLSILNDSREEFDYKFESCSLLKDFAPECHEEITNFCVRIFEAASAFDPTKKSHEIYPYPSWIHQQLKVSLILKDLRTEYKDPIIHFCSCLVKNLTIDLKLRREAQSILKSLGVEA